jgi:gliding motility-associated-like protein
MKKIFFSILFVFVLNLSSYSQAVNVNSTTYTVPQLVQNVLFGGGTSAAGCAGSVSNITWSTGANFAGNPNGIGYFTNTNPNFPLQNGVVMTTGDLTRVLGPNTTTLSDGTNTWTGDAQLQTYIQGLGIDPGLTTYRNASIIEFDFVPLTTTMSFDFLFASEEYGGFQCSFADAFAFFLTNTTTATPAINLALVPSTTSPISVLTIRDTANNSSCGSVNPTFFGSFNGGSNAASSATNFNGQTVKMTANSIVIPGNSYHIKLVIADRNDNAYDSAIFLGGGSFNIGQNLITGTGALSSLNNFTIANSAAICDGKTLTLQAGIAPIIGANYAWTRNGLPIGGNSYTLLVTQPGTYGITITQTSGCVQTDSSIVEYFPPFNIANPVTLNNDCPSGLFNLRDNNTTMLNGLPVGTYQFKYYLTQQAAIDQFPPSQLAPNPTTFSGTNGQTIYVAVIKGACSEVRSFTLNVVSCGLTATNTGPVCPSGTFDLACTTAPVGYTIYTWSGPNGYSAVGQNQTGVPAPTGAGPYVYSCVVTGGALPALVAATTTVVVNPASTITLSSAVATSSQVICQNTALTNITYTTGAGVTGATFTGAPTGVTGTFAGGVFTISGTPSVSSATPFNYTVTTTGGCAPSANLPGTITVNPLPTIALSSAVTTTSQVICQNTALTNITYTIGGSATGATLTGTPTGVTGTFAGGVFTISGTPSVSSATPFNYTVTTTGGCAPSANLPGTITVNPLSSIALSSAVATSSQVICQNTALTNITYTTGVGVTGATLTGAPTGVTGTFAGGVFTISGTPSVSSATPFNYTVTTTGGCAPSANLSGTITVNPLSTITLSSAISTTGQVICQNTALTNITYTIGGSATGATVTGLPTGVTGAFAGGVFTISGTPSVSSATPFNYSVTTTGGCSNLSLVGTIRVNPLSSIALSSGSTSQVLCSNTVLGAIVYTTAGGVTNVTSSGLPVGVTGAFVAGAVSGTGTYTINGTPTIASATPYSYTLNTFGGCLPIASTSGTIEVTLSPTLVLSSSLASQSPNSCINSPLITNIVYTFGATATTVIVTGLPPGITSSINSITKEVTITGTPTMSGVYPYVVTTDGGCVPGVSLGGTITINALPNPIITGINNICVDFNTNTLISGTTLNSGISAASHTFEWFLNGSTTAIAGAIGATLNINTITPGIYTVIATNTATTCVSAVSLPFTVIQSGPPANESYALTNAFTENQILTVAVSGFGTYEYSLDGGTYQSSPVFDHVTIGIHSVEIRDVKGDKSCLPNATIINIETIDYPHYFTPNGDGFNDTWNIARLISQPNAKIYIFDRYGKLLKQIAPTGAGWDGTFNGEPQLATDYWFTVEYLEQNVNKVFKANFSLKR